MYKISKLKNGINLVTIPMLGTKAITVLALFPVGSRYETASLSGASHFVEHMMFKGTKRRPNTQAISRELDAAGAEYNAFTSKDHTGYYIKIDSAQSSLAFDMLSDMLFDSTFGEEEIAKEKGVIVEELRMYEDNPTMSVDSLFDQVSFINNQLGVDIGGTVDSVRNLSVAGLRDYYHHAYQPQNMVLVVAGNIKSAQLKKDLKFFEAIGSQKDKKFNYQDFSHFNWTTNLSIDKRVAVKERKLDQSHLILGFPGLPLGHPDRYAQSVLLNILGGTMSSRLFEEVRNKRGLCYMVHAGGNSFRETGCAQIQAGLDPARLAEAIEVIKAELKKIATKSVSAKELREAKSNLSGRLVLSMEETNAMADWFAKQFWFEKDIKTYEQVLNKIQKVTASQVLRLAKKLFVWNEVRVAVIGSVKKEEIVKFLI